MSISKNHHYIPQFLSRLWAINNTEILIRYNIKSNIGNVGPRYANNASTKNTFCSAHLNSPHKDGTEDFFETKIMNEQFDAKFSLLLNRILTNISFQKDGFEGIMENYDEDSCVMANFISMISFRHPVMINYASRSFIRLLHGFEIYRRTSLPSQCIDFSAFCKQYPEMKTITYRYGNSSFDTIGIPKSIFDALIITLKLQYPVSITPTHIDELFAEVFRQNLFPILLEAGKLTFANETSRRQLLFPTLMNSSEVYATIFKRHADGDQFILSDHPLVYFPSINECAFPLSPDIICIFSTTKLKNPPSKYFADIYNIYSACFSSGTLVEAAPNHFKSQRDIVGHKIHPIAHFIHQHRAKLDLMSIDEIVELYLEFKN